MTRHTDRRPSLPKFSMNRVTISVALVTLFIGQITLLKQVGGLSEVVGLFRVVVWLVVLNMFWPQLKYGVGRLGVALTSEERDHE